MHPTAYSACSRLLLPLLPAVFAFTGPSVAGAQTVSGEHVRQFLGAVHLGADEMQWADSVGAAWSRQGVQWGRHEPDPGALEFETADSLMAAAHRHGVRVMPVLSYAPEWASTAPAEHPNSKHFPPRSEAVDRWKAYVETVVERYPEVEYFEIWNEPNIDWFLVTDENYRVYVERILIPAAEVIHAHGRKVVAPSYTLEWPMDVWPPGERPSRHQRNLSSVIRDVDRWLSYRDAWRHIDVLSVHYAKGDARPDGIAFGDVLLPFFDHVYEKWIATGRIEGIWNTEEGLTATEAGNAGFVALEPWERKPYAQWVPRYVLPFLHWAIRHDWDARHDYKLFWYHIADHRRPRGVLDPTNLLEPSPDRPSGVRPSATGRALATAASLFAGADRVGAFAGDVSAGFGIHAPDPGAANYFPPYEFRTWAFTVDDDLLIAAWIDLPGTALAPESDTGIDVRVDGWADGVAVGAVNAERIHYVTGETVPVGAVSRTGDGSLRLRVRPTGSPVLYLRLETPSPRGPGS